MKVSYRRLWVIEMYNKNLKRWEPVGGTGFSRSECRDELNYAWKTNNPTEKFRIRMYLPEEETINRSNSNTMGNI